MSHLKRSSQLTHQNVTVNMCGKAMTIAMMMMMMTQKSRWYVSLYDPGDRLIAYYRMDGDTTIDRIAATFIFKYSNIEYFKITVNPPDESD